MKHKAYGMHGLEDSPCMLPHCDSLSVTEFMMGRLHYGSAPRVPAADTNARHRGKLVLS